MSFTVKFELFDHEIGKDFYLSKYDLFSSFFTDFYEFIKNHNGLDDLKKYNIKNSKDFLAFADWYADGKDNCYGMGFGFHKYFFSDKKMGKIEEQDESTFIGYCYKNKKYEDFLNFLITFFAWWRNDEHCTTFDPYNYADDFFTSSWAVLVDTCKLFYFTAQTVFHWQSFRVKYAIDNIPGTIKKGLKKNQYKNGIVFNKPTKLPVMVVSGYEFLGWYNEDNLVDVVSGDMTVVAKFKRKDFYNYWEVEEKTIKKVYVEDMKKVDPA